MIACSVADTIKSHRWTAATVSLDDLLDLAHEAPVTEDKGSHGVLFPGVLRSYPGRRRDENIAERTALLIDWDTVAADWTPDAVPWSSVAWETWASAPGAPRYRVVIPLDRPYTAAESPGVKAGMPVLLTALGLPPVDLSCLSLAQCMYMPERAPGATTLRTWDQRDRPVLSVGDIVSRAGSLPEPRSSHVDDSPPRPESDGIHPDAAVVVARELARLDALWDGELWDVTSFAIACNLIEVANANWSGYALGQAEADFLAHAPRDADFNPMRKWESALKTIGAKARPALADPLDDFAVLLDEPGELRREFPRLDLAALLDPNRPQREWVWHGLIPAGASVSLVAAAGSMKSLVVLALALALTRGEPEFAGLPIPRQRRCLLVDMENTEDDLAERMRDLGMRQEDDLGELSYLHLPALPALDGPGGGELLIAICDEYGLLRGDLVVLDSFQRVVEGPEDKSDTYRAFYTHTAAALKRRGFTVLRTDNTGKEIVRGARGSSGKRDDVDLELRMERDGSLLTITPGKSRLAGVEQLELTYGTDDDGRLTFTSIGDPHRDEVERVKSLLSPGLSQRAAIALLKGKATRDVIKKAHSELTEFSQESAPFGLGAPSGALTRNSAPPDPGAPRRTERKAG